MSSKYGSSGLYGTRIAWADILLSKYCKSNTIKKKEREFKDTNRISKLLYIVTL